MLSRPGWAATAAIALAVFGVSCTGEPESSELDRFLCAPEDLTGTYHELARGEMRPDDLRDLGNPGGEVAEGLERGSFVYYSEALPRPPFERPTEVVCQVLEFETAESALAWVQALEPDDSLEGMALIWLPDGEREFTAVESNDTPEADPVSRRFELSASEGDSHLTAVTESYGQETLVITMLVGQAAEAADHDVQWAQLAEIRDAWEVRTASEE